MRYLILLALLCVGCGRDPVGPPPPCTKERATGEVRILMPNGTVAVAYICPSH